MNVEISREYIVKCNRCKVAVNVDMSEWRYNEPITLECDCKRKQKFSIPKEQYFFNAIVKGMGHKQYEYWSYYWGKKESIRGIAKCTGDKFQLVYRRMKRWNIPIRNRKQSQKNRWR